MLHNVGRIDRIIRLSVALILVVLYYLKIANGSWDSYFIFGALLYHPQNLDDAIYLGAFTVCAGSIMFGAVFMATDPVSASFTNQGKWAYGILIGFMTVMIRVLNPAFPEGMMLAILLMNTFSAFIDHFVIQANIRRRKARYAI